MDFFSLLGSVGDDEEIHIVDVEGTFFYAIGQVYSDFYFGKITVAYIIVTARLGIDELSCILSH